MARYVDGFLLPLPLRNVAAYRRLARQASKVFREHGAMAYVETVGDDLVQKGMDTFVRASRAKRGQTVVFSWIVYRSKQHRDRANAAVMKDPRMQAMMRNTKMPFDPKRMAYGGFKVLVDA